MYVSLGIFTQYRRELMGVATVLILLDTGTFYYLIYSFASPTTWYWVV